MSVIDFQDAFRNATQAGQEIVEGNVVKIIADNGDEIGDATLKVIQGGNGQASDVWTIVKETVGGFITAGLSFMSVSLPTAFSALAPCLGVTAGVGIYELVSGDTDFHNRLLNALKEEGKTVGGKVLAYFNGDNLYFDEDTIEIIKRELVAEGVFEGMPKYSNTGNVDITRSFSPSQLFSILLANAHPTLTVGGTAMSKINSWFGQYPNYIPLGWTPNLSGNISDAYGLFEIFLIPPSDNIILPNVPNGTLVIDTHIVNNSIVDAEISPGRPGIGTWVGELTNSTTKYISGINAKETHDLQPDATYPDNNPFPLTYPDWYPLVYPDVVPPGLPTVYPAKYPETQPDPYPSQNPAQNPDPESAPDTLPWIIPDFPLPYPNIDPSPEPSPQPTPQPQPTPTPDPDPVPEPEPIPDPTPDTPINPDPVDPNPDPTPTPVIPVPPLPDTVSSNKLFTVYNPTNAQLNALGGYLWDDSLMEIIKKIWQNPLDGVISLSQVYATPATSGSSNIILGYLDSGVSSLVVSNQFTEIDCGSVQLKETKKNATDYAPYTSLHIYLPFIGITELDVNECMDSTINVKYKVDVYTGSCLATVKITRTKDLPNGGILYTFNGNCAQQLPLTSGSASGLLTGLLSAVGAGLSIASGGGVGLVAGVNMVGNSLNHEMLHVSHSGNISANSGIMGDKKPYLIIGRAHGYDANSYNTFYGYPANKTVFLGNCSGFLKVKDIHLQTSANDTERTEIEQLLKAGVIM